jgi:malonyl-CoA O-methyltransferase
VAVDIAEGMLRHAREQGGAQYHGGRCRAPAAADGSVDLMFSSLAVQWCGQFGSVLARRAGAAPGGVLAFSSLCVGTLDELRASWQAVDGMVHVNRFRRFEDYQRLCAASGLEQLELERRPHVLHYPDVRSLTHELKALGAHNLNPGRPSG